MNRNSLFYNIHEFAILLKSCLTQQTAVCLLSEKVPSSYIIKKIWIKLMLKIIYNKYIMERNLYINVKYFVELITVKYIAIFIFMLS